MLATRAPTRVGRLREAVAAGASVSPPGAWLERVLYALPFVASGVYVLGFLIAGYFRVTYAYPMWVMEVPSVQAVRRILLGEPLYGPPSLAYVPPLYAPLYFYVSALAAQVFGSPLATLRLVSLAASLGAGLLAWHMVWRETRNALAAVVALGLFVGSTALTSNTLDLARVDALCVLWLVASLDATRSADLQRRAGIWLSLASGILGGLAILTKQTAAVVVLALLVHTCCTLRWRRVVAFGIGAGVTVGIAWLVLSAQYGSWLQTYLIELPREHELELTTLGDFWSKQLLPAFTLPLVVGPVFLIAGTGRRFWVLATLGMLALAWGGLLNRYSSENVLLPAYAVLAMLAGLGLNAILGRIGPAARAYRSYLLVLVMIQFLIVHYNPRATSPLRSDTWAAERMVTTLANQPGAVFGPDYAEFLYLAGKGDQAAGLSVDELVGGFGGQPLPEGGQWMQAYADALKARRFDALVLDPQSIEFFLAGLASENGYIDTGPLFPDGDEFYLWGSHFVPRAHLWVPAERRSASP